MPKSAQRTRRLRCMAAAGGAAPDPSGLGADGGGDDAGGAGVGGAGGACSEEAAGWEAAAARLLEAERDFAAALGGRAADRVVTLLADASESLVAL